MCSVLNFTPVLCPVLTAYCTLARLTTAAGCGPHLIPNCTLPTQLSTMPSCLVTMLLPILQPG
jgi:hypothetical protein